MFSTLAIFDMTTELFSSTVCSFFHRSVDWTINRSPFQKSLLILAKEKKQMNESRNKKNTTQKKTCPCPLFRTGTQGIPKALCTAQNDSASDANDSDDELISNISRRLHRTSLHPPPRSTELVLIFNWLHWPLTGFPPPPASSCWTRVRTIHSPCCCFVFFLPDGCKVHYRPRVLLVKEKAWNGDPDPEECKIYIFHKVLSRLCLQKCEQSGCSGHNKRCGPPPPKKKLSCWSFPPEHHVKLWVDTAISLAKTPRFPPPPPPPTGCTGSWASWSRHMGWKVPVMPLKTQTLPRGRGRGSSEREPSVHAGSVISHPYGVRLGHRLRGWGPGVGWVRAATWEACLSCCWCGCRSCTATARNWAGSHTCRAPWGSRWWCRRWSAAAAPGRSWIFRPAAGCFCSASGRRRRRWKLLKRQIITHFFVCACSLALSRHTCLL